MTTENLDALRDEILAEVEAVSDLDALDSVRVSALGRQGRITELMRGLGKVAAEERRERGQALNIVKDTVTGAIAARQEALELIALDARLIEERIDMTLPTRPQPEGRIHPISQTIDEMVAIFCEMGFEVAEGPHIETDFNNFTALNIPPEHPARQEHDTFYLPEKEDGSRRVLRTHTSPVQIRTMLDMAPPIRIIVPGRTFRADYDATHLPMFHQLEALVVDEGISMADLKGTMDVLWKRFYGERVVTRLRPGYFPFVEPGCEYDISCPCERNGCRVCKDTGWIELGGAGMVHPAVFEAVGIDPERYTGFAFGLGIDRIAMMRHGIDDLRLLMENDVRFLRQFPA